MERLPMPLGLAIGLAIGAGCAGADDGIGSCDDGQCDVTGIDRRARAEMIKAAAAQAGLTNAVLLAGIAQVETGLAHCWSEASWTCKGPASPSCNGGPVVAG